MKKLVKLLFVTIMLLFVGQSCFAHEQQDHKKVEKKEAAIDSTTHSSKTSMDTAMREEHEHTAGEEMHVTTVEAKFSDFPTLHPLLVHFPIALLLLAFLAQLLALLVWKKELSLITGILILGGFVGAYLVSTLFHPHTGQLSDAAQQVLDLHDRYANYTVWASGIALLMKVASHFFLKRKLWIEVLVVIAMAVASWSVSHTGHYGATLVHIHAVGPQGKYLETHAHVH